MIIMAFNTISVQSSGAKIGLSVHGRKVTRFDGRLNALNLRRAFHPDKTGLIVMACEVKFYAPTDFQRQVTGDAVKDVARFSARKTPPNQGLAGVLSRSRPVYAADMRGQVIRGSRVASADASEFTLDKYMGDIEAIREKLGTEQLALCAYSPGGFFATHYAIRNPDKVSALILIEPAIYTEKDDLVQRARLAESGGGVKAMEAMLSYIDPKLDPKMRYQYAASIVADWHSPDVIGRVYRLHADSLISDEMLEPLRKIPVLLIGGTNSAMSFHVKRIARAVPEASVWWIKGADHLSLMSKKSSEQIKTVVDNFLAGV